MYSSKIKFKFYPFIYSFAREVKIKNYYFSQIMEYFIFPTIPFIYLVVFWEITTEVFIKLTTNYLFFYFIFYSFYEIWYLFNDFRSVRIEKSPTIRNEEKLNEKDFFFTIISRVFIGLWWLYISYKLRIPGTYLLVMNIIFSMLIFFIHNKIRNYFINYITVTLLRTTKIFIVWIILYNSGYKEIFNILFLYFFINLMFGKIRLIFSLLPDKIVPFGNNNSRVVGIEIFAKLYFSCAMLFICLALYSLSSNLFHTVFIPYYVALIIKNIKIFKISDYHR